MLVALLKCSFKLNTLSGSYVDDLPKPDKLTARTSNSTARLEALVNTKYSIRVTNGSFSY